MWIWKTQNAFRIVNANHKGHAVILNNIQRVRDNECGYEKHKMLLESAKKSGLQKSEDYWCLWPKLYYRTHIHTHTHTHTHTRACTRMFCCCLFPLSSLVYWQRCTNWASRHKYSFTFLSMEGLTKSTTKRGNYPRGFARKALY